jgi:adenylate cyclase class 2
MKPERLINPGMARNGETPELNGHPLEIEVKILDIDPVEFIQKIESAGGTLLRERRLLHDTSFGLKKIEIPLNLLAFKDPEEARAGLQLLGVAASENIGTETATTIQNPLPRRTVRIRQDGNETFLTIKAKRDKRQQVTSRVEREIEIIDVPEVTKFLRSLGYRQRSVREKYRTTYELEGIKVEINEGPIGKPWVEIEGDSEENIIKVAALLGYKEENLHNMSDKEQYRSQGVTEEQLNNLTFNAAETN